MKQGARSKIGKIALIALCVIFVAVMLIVPLASVLVYALREGWEVFSNAIGDQYTIAALNLTLYTALIALLVNTVFGVFSSWAITKFRFRGKSLLTTIIDIPFAISPVIAGLVFILIFGRFGWAGPLFESWDIKVVFAVPGIVLATVFVTFPFISRELIPLMHSQGADEEEAAALMGAKGLRIYRKVTLPHIKWGLLYGIILCTARALGEFGAVSVVSGKLRGKTNTLPLHVEQLFQEFHLTASFAAASILVIIAVIILILKTIVEYRGKKEEDLHVR
jgi:sulfate transport system permease protein